MTLNTNQNNVPDGGPKVNVEEIIENMKNKTSYEMIDSLKSVN